MRRKTRTILTVLSVVIGIFSIVLMMSFGFGIQKQQEAFIKELGGLRTVNVSPKNMYRPESNEPVPTNGIITDSVLKEIDKNPSVIGYLAGYSTNINMSIVKKNYEFWSRVMVYNEDDLRANGITLEDGSPLPKLGKFEYFITNGTYPTKMVSAGRGESFGEDDPTFNFSSEKVNFLLGFKEPPGSINLEGTKQYEEVKATFRGRLSKSDNIDFGIVIVNEETANILTEKYNKLMGNNTRISRKTSVKIYDEARVFVDEINNVASVRESIESMGLYANSMTDFIETENERNLVIQLVLAGIGSIALIVAAIGISNTMLMSIQERTKEIGVMKVIGAQIKDIRKMFLIEAMLIGLIGGITGVLLSYLGSMIINNLASGSSDMVIMGTSGYEASISYIPIWLPFIAVGFSAMVGLFAGYLPARRATKLSAIEAIRTN